MGKEYNISKTSGVCCTCGNELSPGDEFVATLKEAGDDFHRDDYCPSCWEGAHSQQQVGVLGVWSTRVPDLEQKKKLFVDNELLIDSFQRLEGTEEPAKINFRFVLTLVLMRKKLLVYEGSEKTPEGNDVWTMRLKGTEQTHRVIDPHMDEEKISEVSKHLSEILEVDL